MLPRAQVYNATFDSASFGADERGVIDSTGAFKAALNSLGDGGTLTIPDGSFLISTIDVTKGNFRLIGNGRLVCSGAVTNWLKFTGTNITIEGPTFDGANLAQNIVRFGNYSDRIKVRRSTFKRGQANDTNDPGKVGMANGLLFDKGIDDVEIEQNIFEDITYDGQRNVAGVDRFCAGVYAVALSAASSVDHFYNWRISDNKFFRIGQGKVDADGVRLQGYSITLPSGIIVKGNHFVGCGWRAGKFLLGGVIFDGNWIYSLEPGPVVTRAMFSAASFYGSNSSAEGNHFFGGAAYRVFEAASTSLGRVENIVIKGNSISLPADDGTYNPETDSDGIYLGNVRGGTVSGNTIRHARFGINAQGWNEHLAIGQNSIFDAGTLGVYFQRESNANDWTNTFANNCTITGTTAEGYSNYAVQVDAGATNVTIVGTQGASGFGGVNRGSGVTGESAANYGSAQTAKATSGNANYYFEVTAAATATDSILWTLPFGNVGMRYHAGTDNLAIGRAGASSINTLSGTRWVVNGSSVDASAALAINATDKGFLPPRMTKAQRDAISSPSNGVMIYQSDNTPGIRVRENGAWVKYTATADP